MADQALVDEVVEAVRSGVARSRSEVATVCGFSGQKASTLLGLAVRAGKLKVAGRDARSSPIYELSQARHSGIVAEVVA